MPITSYPLFSSRSDTLNSSDTKDVELKNKKTGLLNDVKKNNSKSMFNLVIRDICGTSDSSVLINLIHDIQVSINDNGESPKNKRFTLEAIPSDRFTDSYTQENFLNDLRLLCAHRNFMPFTNKNFKHNWFGKANYPNYTNSANELISYINNIIPLTTADDNQITKDFNREGGLVIFDKRCQELLDGNDKIKQTLVKACITQGTLTFQSVYTNQTVQNNEEEEGVVMPDGYPQFKISLLKGGGNNITVKRTMVWRNKMKDMDYNESFSQLIQHEDSLHLEKTDTGVTITRVGSLNINKRVDTELANQYVSAKELAAAASFFSTTPEGIIEKIQRRNSPFAEASKAIAKGIDFKHKNSLDSNKMELYRNNSYVIKQEGNTLYIYLLKKDGTIHQKSQTKLVTFNNQAELDSYKKALETKPESA